MKPKNSPTPQADLFKNRLENIINNQHKLVKLSALIDSNLQKEVYLTPSTPIKTKINKEPSI